MQQIDDKDILKDAWGLFESKEYDTALSKLKSLNKENAGSCYLTGLIAYFQNNFVEAESQLLKVLQQYSSVTFKGYVHHWLGNVYGFDDFFTDVNNPIHDKKKAEQEYNLAIKEESYPVEAYHELIKMKSDDIEKEDTVLQAIEAFPLDVDLYYSLNLLYQRQGNTGKQKSLLIKAIENDIKSSTIHFLFGKLLFSEKKYGVSLEHFSKALAYNKDSKQAALLISYYIGASEFYLSNFEKSLQFFSESANYNQYDTSSWYPRIGYIFSLYKLKKKRKVYEYIETVDFDLKLFYEISFNYNLMSYLDASSILEGELLFPTKNVISILKSTISSKVSSQYKLKVNLLLAALYNFEDDELNGLNCYRELHAYSYQYDFINSSIKDLYLANIDNPNNYEATVAMFQEDIRQNSLKSDTKGEVLIIIIEKLFKLKNYNKVLDICKYIDQQDSIPSEIYFEYAYCLAELGQANLAKGYYEKVIQSNNKSTAALNNLGIIYKQEDDLQKAISLFKSASKFEPDKALYKKNLKDTEHLLVEKEKAQKSNLIPKHWLETKQRIDIHILTDLNYFAIINKMQRTNKKYRPLLVRDFEELTFNYLVGNHKSTVILSGSLVELALTYFCEKRKLLHLELADDSGKIRKVKLYNAVLNDLVIYSHQQNWFGNDFHSLGNLSRIYRNFIHPGLEIKTRTEIDSKAKLCYLSTIEILKKVLNS